MRVSTTPTTRRKIFTWHIHGSYLYYLTQTNCEFYLPKASYPREGYGGKTGPFPWGEHVHELPIEEVKHNTFDLILFQSKQAYLIDQYEIFSEAQRKLPKIYVEHDPPREHPTDTEHIVKDPSILVVHVSHFNQLMWDNGNIPTKVIEHGVKIPKVTYSGEIQKGVVVINNLSSRGRRLGADIFQKVRKSVPLDLIGMDSSELGGLGEIPHNKLLSRIAQYRFFFHPIRYTSFGLALCESMMAGVPIVGFSTTELSLHVQNEITGFSHLSTDRLIAYMQMLLKDKEIAQRISTLGKRYAISHFSIRRFARDWEKTIEEAIQMNVWQAQKRSSNQQQYLGYL